MSPVSAAGPPPHALGHLDEPSSALEPGDARPTQANIGAELDSVLPSLSRRRFHDRMSEFDRSNQALDGVGSLTRGRCNADVRDQ